MRPFKDPSTDKLIYFTVWPSFSGNEVVHTRRIYSLLDLFGDYGGLSEVLSLILTVFLGPWAELNYYLKALQKMYAVKSKKNL